MNNWPGRRFALSALLVAATFSPSLHGQTRPRVSASVTQLAWLAGAWTGGNNGVTTEERWTPPSGGAMLATGRTVRDATMVEFEFLRIVERDGTLVYIAQPNGRPPTEFVLASIDRQLVTFENPRHDFPQVIQYAQQPDGSLRARVSAGTKAIVFNYQPIR